MLYKDLSINSPTVSLSYFGSNAPAINSNSGTISTMVNVTKEAIIIKKKGFILATNKRYLTDSI